MYAGASKLLDYERFRIELGKSPLLAGIAEWVGWALPAGEILLSTLLVIPRFQTLALFMAFSLMVMFTAYLITILNFSFYVPCTCGGILQGMSWKTHIQFNLVILLLTMTAILSKTNKLSAIDTREKIKSMI
jgi:uncharacterized membrane protein YphA (DoxX/SURF4 family)